MRAYVRGVLCVVFVAVISTAAFAVDGVVLINQNSALAGIGGCDTPGFPITICQPGSYRLSGNLTVPNANTEGIDITADNVSLDLNGFSIIGSVTCGDPPGGLCSTSGSGDGVFSLKDNVTIRNGSVMGMGNIGVHLLGVGGLVEEVHAKFNSNIGIYLSGGTVRRSAGLRNGFYGIFVSAGVLEASTAQGNGYGLVAEHSTVIGNTSFRNANGLYATYSVYGSNSLQGNQSQDVIDGGSAVSQNNNICTNGQC